MPRSLSKTAVAVLVCIGFASAAFAKNLNTSKTPTPRRSQTTAGSNMLTLEIAGPTDSQAAAAFQKAFAANGLAAKVQESKKGGKPLKLMAQIDKSSDLSPWSKAVASALPTKKDQLPPAVELVVFAPLTKENSQQVIAELEKVKGVDAKHSTADLKKGTLRVRISGTDQVTAEEISKAIQTAGVSGGQFAKAPKTKKTT